MRKIQLLIKRLFDIIISAVGVILLLPVWLILIAIMEITMPGPVFFTQERVGKKFKVFKILMFRTMKVDKDAEANFKIEKDLERLTGFGKILRRTKLDETPQLINILKGDMSIVGPRPTVPQRVKEFYENQDIRLSMSPGLTGLSQVKGSVLLSWPRRVEYDCQYVKEFSIMLDIKILLKTVPVILFGEEKYISQEDLKNYRNPFYDITHKTNGQKISESRKGD